MRRMSLRGMQSLRLAPPEPGYGSRVATIALVYLAMGGHIGPIRRLGATLARHGHRVIDVSPRGEVSELQESAAAETLAPTAVPVFDPFDDAVEIAATLAETTPQATRQLVEVLLHEQVDLVVYDVMVPWGRVAAKWLGLPAVSSWALFPTLTIPGARHSKRQPFASEDHMSRLRAAVEAVDREWGVYLGDSVGVAANPGDRTLVFTSPEIAGPVELHSSWRLVGPMMGPPGDVSEPLLAEWGDEPLVYMALGTVFTDRRALFRATLEALAEEPVRLLVSTWQRFSAADLAPIPPNARVAEHVVSRAVLRHASLHVTHGGGGSVHESLLAGVPMLCLPQGSDQSAWAARVAALGAAEVVADESPAAIRDGVRRLLADETAARRARELGAGLERYDGAKIAVEAVAELL
jgi:MGT family glycosyltransferase